MPSPSSVAAPLRPDADAVNELIRRLMDQPSGEQRTQEYRRLLRLWAQVTDHHIAEAA